MTYGSGRESIDLPEDRGCLQWVLGVPLGIIHVLNAVAVFAALYAGPQGEWDDQGYAGVGAMCLISMSLSALGLLITIIPGVRRTMGLWWLAPPIVLGLTAFIRGETLG
ncbi:MULTISPECIES: hypothetical protein [unclassified Streptomyces]|uniref:hypothetical protein n=1 Tax=unclassified Streptomyces TaxID=2593676 RepID=UPI002E14CC70|nr:hypothetical protein OG299_17610 [Streptomyces sp. NBC_01296]WSW61218.1 hypothetical protein OG513_23040 [Streptomyces sp. NBC_00998]